MSLRTQHTRFRLVSITTVKVLKTGRPIVKIVFYWDGKKRTRTIKCGKLLGDGDSNVKLSKNSQMALAYGLSLAPARMVGTHNMCFGASPACIRACLNETGNGFQFDTTQLGRLVRTHAFLHHRDWFLPQLHRELSAAERKAEELGIVVCVRLNVFSDLPWERIDDTIFSDHASIEFYDYTKIRSRVGALRPNYWVTFSRSEINETQCVDQLNSGKNVAIVFHDGLPKRWNGFTVINGDTTDLRFTDPRGLARGYVIGLKLKAPTNKKRHEAITSGFAITAKA